MTLKRVLQMIFGGTGCLCFFLPMLLGGIFNIGTISGLLLYGSLFLWGLFRPRIVDRLETLRQKRLWRVVTSAICLLFCAGLLLVAAESALMLRAALNAPPEDASATVLVLGCRVRGTVPSRAMRQRLDAAEDYLLAHPDAVCILSGGQGEDEEISEADCMYRELIARGVAADRLYREDRSTSTRENFAFSREIIRENGFSETVAVVTNEYHQYRAGLIAGDLGLQTYAVSALSGIGLLPTYWMREFFGIVYEWLF